MNATGAPKPRRFAPLVWTLWIAAALLVKPLQDRVDGSKSVNGVIPDQIYFGSPAVVKALSLGYESLLADVYWMRSIQYFGRRLEADRRPVRYGNLSLLLDITTTLDPMLLDAYRAGSSFLAEPEPAGAGQPGAALELLDKGISHHPGDWRLYYDKGFVYFWFLKDFAKAGEMWLIASRQPGSPSWMEALTASALSRGGAVETARTLWQRQYQESVRADLKANARNHLDSLQVDEDLWALEFFIERYRRRTGRPPSDYRDLVQAGMLRALPLDPSGVPYSYDTESASPQLSIRSGVRYVAVPYDYRDAFMEKLNRAFPESGR